MLFERATICGVGLIGGSLAGALRNLELAREVVGFDRSLSHLRFALKKGLIDKATRSCKEAARRADIVVLATPVLAMPSVLSSLVEHLPQGAVVTDVGSVKAWVVRALEPVVQPRLSFVPAHPLAGKEIFGPQGAEPKLFQGARVVITPCASSHEPALALVETMWRRIGAKVERMKPESHDELLARASHLPQLVASALALSVGRRTIDGRRAMTYGAGGLRDTTRLALSESTMWRDICLANQKAILAALDEYQEALREFRLTIERSDEGRLEKLFEESRKLRSLLK